MGAGSKTIIDPAPKLLLLNLPVKTGLQAAHDFFY